MLNEFLSWEYWVKKVRILTKKWPKSEWAKSEQAKSEWSKLEQAKLEQAKSEQAKSDQVKIPQITESSMELFFVLGSVCSVATPFLCCHCFLNGAWKFSCQLLHLKNGVLRERLQYLVACKVSARLGNLWAVVHKKPTKTFWSSTRWSIQIFFSVCDAGYEYYDGSCYKLISTLTVGTNAQGNCEAEGGNFISILLRMNMSIDSMGTSQLWFVSKKWFFKVEKWCFCF